ncbi:MAG TPA: magnesium transporter CorA family protein [Xanthomonadales bacterium]|nr:magnesium transporter CorA family protein [Xanthomonadales bacterium]
MNIPTVTHNGISFINLSKPTDEQVKFLNKNFGFSMLNLEDYLYKTQIPKIEMYKDYSLLVMDIPFIQQAAKSKKEKAAGKPFFIPNAISSRISLPIFPKAARKKRISVGEVDFFIGKDYVVVLHDETTPQIDELFEMCKITSKHREELMGKGSVYLLYRIIDILVDSVFSYIDDISNTIDYIDRQLDEDRSVSVIEDISMTRRNIVVFETMIKPALPIFADLEKGKYKELNGEMMPYWSNILDHLQKIWERLEDNKELIEGISKSYESFLSSRTNEIIKVLTLFTTILLPLTLIASIYGMNVPLPFEKDPNVFWLVMLVMIGTAVVMVAFFKLRDWL